MNLRLFATILLAAATARAQSVPAVQGAYRVGGIGIDWQSTCGFLPPGNPPGVWLDDGNLTLRADGTLDIAINNFQVCPGGVAGSSTDTGSGAYHVGDDGVIRFDDLPASPGVEHGTLFLRADGSLAVLTRIGEDEDDAFLDLIVRLSSGNGPGTLAGSYSVVRLSLAQGAASMTSRSDLGTMSFDGVGTSSESGTSHLATFAGSTTTSPYGPIAASYAVAGDGTLTIGGATGAVTHDGEAFFVIRHAGGTVEMTVGLRRGAAYGAATVAGDYGICSFSSGLTAASTQVLSTAFGTSTFTPTFAGGGALLHDQFVVDTPRAGFPTSGQTTTTTSYTLQTGGAAAGALTLGPAATAGALSADGSLLIATPRSAAGNGLMIGVARCAAAHAHGAGTAGTGALVPDLFTVGGFPYAGNAGFGLVAVRCLGGSPAIVAVSLGTSTGLPLLGGTVWIDPNQIIATTTLTTSGPAFPGLGAAALPLPLPDDVAFSGLLAAAQVFVLDAGAPQGIAMTGAVQFTVCR